MGRRLFRQRASAIRAHHLILLQPPLDAAPSAPAPRRRRQQTLASPHDSVAWAVWPKTNHGEPPLDKYLISMAIYEIKIILERTGINVVDIPVFRHITVSLYTDSSPRRTYNARWYIHKQCLFWNYLSYTLLRHLWHCHTQAAGTRACSWVDSNGLGSRPVAGELL